MKGDFSLSVVQKDLFDLNCVKIGQLVIGVDTESPSLHPVKAITMVYRWHVSTLKGQDQRSRVLTFDLKVKVTDWSLVLRVGGRTTSLHD